MAATKIVIDNKEFVVNADISLDENFNLELVKTNTGVDVIYNNTLYHRDVNPHVYRIRISFQNIPKMIPFLLDTDTISIETKNWRTDDAKIVSIDIDDRRISIECLSNNISFGNFSNQINIDYFDICSNTGFPANIHFLRIGNYIYVICHNEDCNVSLRREVIKNGTITFENVPESQRTKTMFSIGDKSSVMYVHKFNLNPSDQHMFLEFTLRNGDHDGATVLMYTNAPEPFSDIIVQRVAWNTYHIFAEIHDSVKKFCSVWLEAYQVDDNDNETLVAKVPGNSAIITLPEGFNRIYIKALPGFLATADDKDKFIISSYTELYNMSTRFVLQFLTQTVLLPGEKLRFVAFDDLIIEVPGHGTYECNAGDTCEIEMKTPGVYTCSVYSKTRYRYIGRFTINVLGEKSQREFYEIVFDEKPMYNKPVIMRLNTVELDPSKEIEIEVDEGNVEVIDSSSGIYKVTFTKPFENVVRVKDKIDGSILYAKIVNVDIGTYDFNFQSTENGFRIKSPFWTTVVSDYFVKTLRPNEESVIDCYTTGKFRCRLTMVVGDKLYKYTMTFFTRCDNGRITNPYGRSLVFMHPNQDNIDDLEWYIDGSLIAGSSWQIEVPEKYGDNVTVKVKYWCNGIEFEHEESVELKPVAKLKLERDAIFDRATGKIVVGNKRLVFEYVGNRSNLEYKWRSINGTTIFYATNFKYIGNNRYLCEQYECEYKS